MKKDSQYKDDKLLNIFCYLIVPVVLSFPITYFLDWWYFKNQKSFFMSSNTLLFLHSEITKWIILYSPFLIMFLIVIGLRNSSSIRIIKIRALLLIPVIISAVSIFILIYEFFEYTDINQDGIRIRNGIFSTNKNYQWNDIDNVQVSYKRGYRNKIDPIYDIHLKDGTVLNTCDAEDFYSNIITLDNFIKDNKIKIIRSKIQPNDYNDLRNSFSEDRLEVVLEILNG
ncbi:MULTISPECIES: hypothetical protein [unclassified Clostridium]|uniref:hypothetical protein n=1 Tax=unclassified Clostridium TaxID=2614128 RepID=UPI00029834BA|nr:MULTISPECIES: hypothetical protein [unclassified Clostridium]EKQ57618.1 MAG: hypothetical protein A370_00750 [Clostridium sp. Maddingley MBC34-26]